MGWRMCGHRVGDAYGADMFHMHVQLVGLIWPIGVGGGGPKQNRPQYLSGGVAHNETKKLLAMILIASWIAAE